jgi:hypothetical protein
VAQRLVEAERALDLFLREHARDLGVASTRSRKSPPWSHVSIACFCTRA